MLLVRVEAEVRPTEDPEKVVKAVKNLLDIELKVIELPNEYKLVTGESSNINPLRKLHALLRQERILDAARSYMLRNRRGNSLELKLHKQAAYVGRISLVTYDEESPMGPIRVIIASDKINDIIDWLAPPTSQGRPIWEKPPPQL